MMKKVLITGGAGFIGSRLAIKLLSKGHNVRVLDSLTEQVHGSNPYQSPLFKKIDGKVDFIRGDVRDRDVLFRALENIDTVVHYAAETGTGQSMYSICHYTDVNIAGTANLLELIASGKTNISQVVVASSRAVYGEGKYRCPDHGFQYPSSRRDSDMASGDYELHCPLCNAICTLVPTDEASQVKPASVYGITKLTQEQLVLVMGASLGISAIAFRYQNVYGAGQSLTNPYTGILSIFSTRIRNGNGVVIFEDGKESRDFVHVDDVVSATIAGIEHPEPIVDVFNVGFGSAIDVLTLAEGLKSRLGVDVPIEVSGRYRLGDIRHNVADLSHITNTLGYRPMISFNDGLDRFVSWVKGEAVPEDLYEESLKKLAAKGLFK